MPDDFPLFASSGRPASVTSRTVPVETSIDIHKDREKSALSEGFSRLGLDDWLVDALAGLGIHRPTSVQKECIPEILYGKDVLAAAKTGSGKTAAFALPILHLLARNPYGGFALVLTPTRELALQISEQFQALGRSFHVNVCTVVGGLDIMTQALELNKRPHIIVGTPGRIADLITSSNFEFKRIQFLVFDEADRLVDPKGSFMRSEIPTVLESVGNKNTHWLFFSATLTSPVLKFKQDRRIMHPMFKFSGNTEFGTSDDVRQYFLLVPSQARDAYLIFLLREFIKNSSVIVFTGKCRTCELVVETLRQLNVVALALHGKMPQRSRIASLNKFRSGASKLLITTDVGSRGLDIPQVAVVINFDLPADARDYVHRIGRTGRSSRPGTALSLVNEIDLEILKSIENSTGKLMENFPGSLEDGRILATLNEVSAAKRRASMILHDKKFGEKAEKNKNKWKK